MIASVRKYDRSVSGSVGFPFLRSAGTMLLSNRYRFPIHEENRFTIRIRDKQGVITIGKEIEKLRINRKVE